MHLHHFPNPKKFINSWAIFTGTLALIQGVLAIAYAWKQERWLKTLGDCLINFLMGKIRVDSVFCFSYNSTDALNLIIFGILKEGNHPITTTLEHNSVLSPPILMLIVILDVEPSFIVRHLFMNSLVLIKLKGLFDFL